MNFLDTSFLIDIRIKNPNITEILISLDEDGMQCTNSIVAHEFLVGGYGSFRKNEVEIRKELLNKFIIFPFNDEAAYISSQIEDKLRKSGEPIGVADVLIAGTMLSNGISTIYTRNVKHFKKIDGITIETWKRAETPS